MKRNLIAALVLTTTALFAAHANAQWSGSQQTLGNQTYGNYSNYSNGETMRSNSQTIGNTVYTNQTYSNSSGQSTTQRCSSQQIGNQIYTRCN
ncbi:hypothetical protein [Paraburkholderia sp. 32]|uniref:hypothetical protein n=1 Tax=Paraburkholderia sp. 32 TaxID=2991057 RepID=UPI003D213425